FDVTGVQTCALPDFPGTFDVRRTRNQTDELRMTRRQLLRVLDADNALARRYDAQQRTEQRALACTRPAADQERQPGGHDCLEHPGCLRVERARPVQLLQIERRLTQDP